jgi:glucose-1-phosphate cytidylyltransferase
MKVVILAGGYGTRMGEETQTIPKPMIEVGGKPIIWHIMKIYSQYGFNEFIVCLGYKGKVIKEYFLDYAAREYDCSISLGTEQRQIHQINDESKWLITLIDTGLNTQTGGRIKRVTNYIGNNTFMATYGDGVANINITKLLNTHRFGGKLGTLTGVSNQSRFGEIEVDETGSVSVFEEKSNTTIINGGFFVFQPAVLDLITGDNDPLEIGLLKRLTATAQLSLYEHDGFWGCMDSPKEVVGLNTLWNSGNPPWKIW